MQFIQSKWGGEIFPPLSVWPVCLIISQKWWQKLRLRCSCSARRTVSLIWVLYLCACRNTTSFRLHLHPRVAAPEHQSPTFLHGNWVLKSSHGAWHEEDLSSIIRQLDNWRRAAVSKILLDVQYLVKHDYIWHRCPPPSTVWSHGCPRPFLQTDLQSLAVNWLYIAQLSYPPLVWRTTGDVRFLKRALTGADARRVPWSRREVNVAACWFFKSAASRCCRIH